MDHDERWCHEMKLKVISQVPGPAVALKREELKVSKGEPSPSLTRRVSLSGPEEEFGRQAAAMSMGRNRNFEGQIVHMSHLL